MIKCPAVSLFLALAGCAAFAEEFHSFYISNHDQSPTHRVIHPIIGQTNVVYDAKGALEKIRGEAIAFLVKDSANVTIRNLRLDWERPCMTEAKIVDFADGETIVEIDRNLYPVTFRGGRLWMTGPGWTNETRYCMIFDGRTRELLPRAGDVSYDGSARELPDGRIALRHDFSTCGDGAKEGDVIALRPTLRDFPAVVVYNSKDVVLEDVVIHDSKGMGLIAQRSENVTWRGTKTAADRTSGTFPRPGCYSSLHADASHFSNVKGQVTVENCWFEGMMDDAINVHSTCLAITNVIAANRIRCRYMHAQAVGFEVFRPGETLRFMNGATLENGPEVRVTAVETHDEREVTLTLAEPLPAGWGVGDAVENADYQCAATFRNNIVRSNRARGSLFTTPKPVLVESNLFDRVTGAAILFSGDDYYWYESGACRDVVIRGNVFSNCFATTGGYSRGILSFYPVVRDVDAQRRCYHGNVLIEGNAFVGFDAPLIFALSVENLTWRDNRVAFNDLYPGLEQTPFVFRHCRNVTIDGRKAPDDTPMATEGRVETPFNDGWEFRKEPETAWRSVHVPHDWAVESRFDPKGEAGAGRLPYAGTGWYRKTFVLPEASAGQCVFLDVGGAMAESDVYLNGVRVGGRTYGFTSYRVNLTPALRTPGEENRLEIRCHVPAKSARFYFGAGLYRNVSLVRTAPIHVGRDGVCIRTEVRPDGSAKVTAQVDVKGPLPFIRNSWKNPSVWGGKVAVENRVLGEDGLVIRRPKLWSPETPHLYTLETVVTYEGRETDRVRTRFGVRTLAFDPRRGFFLNGRYRQMKGVCLHHDLGSLGAAFDRGAFERQVKILKEMGADAIRTSHNPPDREVLDVCDERGLLVMDEAFDTWNRHKSTDDYAKHFADWHRRDLADFIRRDRNHPCVVMWSVGNEIPGTLERPRATASAAIGRELTRLCHQLDPTRLTTMGHCRSWAMTNGMERATDVFGANYLNVDYAWYLAHGAGKCGLVATETCSAVSTRGENDLTTFRRHNCLPEVEFAAQTNNPACYGEFVWTGFDYLGEPDPYAEKGARSSYYGILDLCGFPKERYWTYRAHWRPENPGVPDRASAGPVACLELTQERFRELSFVKIRAVDAAGATVTNFSGRLVFSVSGAGRLVGVGNGDPMDYDSLKGDSIRAFHGLAQAIVRGPSYELKVRSDLGEQTISINDPERPKDLVTRATSPVFSSRLADGSWFLDFGRDAFGWLELRGLPEGRYHLVTCEMTNSLGEVRSPMPRTAIRCLEVSGRTDGSAVFRVPFEPDPVNTKGYGYPTVPAVNPPRERFGIVAPFRFVRVIAAPEGFTPQSAVRQVLSYPFEDGAASFASDNAILNEVFDFCRHSIVATSFAGIYVDGDRERTPYEADAYINQLGHYAIDNDYAMARRTHEWLMDHATWPTEWKQHSIMMAWADWMWTGDNRSVLRRFDQLDREKLLTLQERADGLLVTDVKTDIVDWPEKYRGKFDFRPVNAVVNAFHYRNLLEMADLADAVGRDAGPYRTKAARMREAYRRVFLDVGTGFFRDGEGSDHHSLQSVAAAVAFGLADEGERPRLGEYLAAQGMDCGVYFAQYLLEALFRSGQETAGVRLMAGTGPRSWKGMMDFGSTISLEVWDMSPEIPNDINHAWGTAALNVLSRYVLGVTPAEPGFRRISIRPQTGGLAWVKGTVPTARGPVRVEVGDGRLTVSSPAPATVVWRGRTYDIPAGTRDRTFAGGAATCPSGVIFSSDIQ